MFDYRNQEDDFIYFCELKIYTHSVGCWRGHFQKLKTEDQDCFGLCLLHVYKYFGALWVEAPKFPSQLASYTAAHMDILADWLHGLLVGKLAALKNISTPPIVDYSLSVSLKITSFLWWNVRFHQIWGSFWLAQHEAEGTDRVDCRKFFKISENKELYRNN